MFITNFDSVNLDKVKLVDKDTKNYIQSRGILPLSYDEKTDKWAFVITPTLLSILRKGDA